tara:strand:- start:20724 stop:21029 length:306 start_codon:yes stop_codon:yes gene_type:complete
MWKHIRIYPLKVGNVYNNRMKLYRQQKLIEKLIKFRWKRYAFDQIKVEVYDRFDGDEFMCRLEVFQGGRKIENRIIKHEATLDKKFVLEAENKLETILTLD